MEHTELLNQVFRFKHKMPSDRQDEVTCASLRQQFAAFVSNLHAVNVERFLCGRVDPLADDRVVPATVFSSHEIETLQEVCRRLTNPAQSVHKYGDVWLDPWLPMYGCVIQQTMLNSTAVKLEVLFVDGWERALHFLPTGECVHSSVPKTHNVLHCANLKASDVPKFQADFAKLLHEAKQCKRSERSAAVNELGHQKTPQFIAAIVRRAVASIEDDGQDTKTPLAPRGDTTDVGLHTGGRARDTCWPLVKAAISQNLCCGRGLLRKTVVLFRLSLLQTAVRSAEKDFRHGVDAKKGCDIVDDLFFMLQCVVQKAVELLECGYDVSALNDRCASLRATILGFIDDLNRRMAAKYALPASMDLKQITKLSRGVEIYSPKQKMDSSSDETSEERRRRASEALAGCCFVDGAKCTLQELLEWESTLATTTSSNCTLVLRTFEAFMFAKSHQLNDETFSNFMSTTSDVFFERMQRLVTKYQEAASEWRQLPQTTTVLGVEQRSREVLVTWIAFCLVHQTCVDDIPLCAEYSIALDWRDLKVVVLRDKAAISALQQVAKYIRGWNERTRGGSLFDLSNQGPTFEFGRRFGLSSPSMNAIYDREVEAWEDHVQSKWNAVEQKKREAGELRAAISREREKLPPLERELQYEQARLNREFPYAYNHGSRLRTQLRRAIRAINVTIDGIETTLSRTLVVPKYPVRPLPPAKDDAMQMIFMMKMPRGLAILGNLCLTAQRSLAPVEPTSSMKAMPSVSSTPWTAYYSERTPSSGCRSFSEEFTVSPGPFALPSSYGPSTVDNLHSLSQYVEECVWSPTVTCSAMTWKDRSGVTVNPFAASKSSIIDSFTEKFPRTFDHFQWMNAFPGEEEDTRGNLVYANLYQKPEDFEKTTFIALGSMRAFPNQQFRKLQCALLEDSLPWSNSIVKTIVRQALYQVGDLTDEAEPQFLWKTDMLQGQKGWSTFCATLKILADKLEQTPRSFECVPLLSELAGYAHQFTGEAASIAMQFAAMVRRWAENEESARQEFGKDSTSVRIAEARQKECVLYGYAVLAYKLGPWDAEAAQDVCELIVLFRNSLFCASVGLVSTEEMLQVERSIAEMMSQRIAELVTYVKKRGMNAVLTVLVRLVSETPPASLEWKLFDEVKPESDCFGSCFEASHEESGTHYSINLLTGSVMTDGYTPGGLPKPIRKHLKFQALFGCRNFEVFPRNGVFRTECKCFDRLYDFALTERTGDLFVQELTTDGSGGITSTLQLCSVHWIESCCKYLSSRLEKLYSHWYWIERKCVFFRPKTANNREVLFVAVMNEDDGVQCYKVPLSASKLSYEMIRDRISSFDRFIPREEPLLAVLHVLGVFEDEWLLHPLKSPEGVVKIELPRFRLSFLLNKRMQFECVEHKGYVLATRQQFEDFLPKFSRYLVLERQNKLDMSLPELKLLVPVGLLVELSDGMIDVEISTEPDAHVEIACFDQHRRLRVFESETIGARLQLAAICASAGCSVPSKRLQMTGEEAALQILRACRSSRPYSTFERDLLMTIYKFSYREPAVRILVEALMTEAYRLAFLFGQSQAKTTAVDTADEKSEYSDMCSMRVQRNTLRSHFRIDEEKLIFGHVKRSVNIPENLVKSLDPSPVREDYVTQVEAKLRALVCDTTRRVSDVPDLPLLCSSDNAMSKCMLEELKRSWECHHSQAHVGLQTTPDDLLDVFTSLLDDVASSRAEMETHLWVCFAKATSTKRDHLLSLANFVPTMTMSDVVRCAFDDETLYTLVPTLSAKAREEFRRFTLQLMELCVLGDKMERIVAMEKRRKLGLTDVALVKELANTRQWQSKEFPYWLSFEVEGGLQIRHEQFVIARHLIDQPGTVCQLNMGCGKTRVILPMLFLYFTQRRSSRVVRAHFLSPLLSEAQQFMHRFLSASSARLGVFEQPFHRQIELNGERLEVVRDTLRELAQFGGIQMVAPEHQMSLELKRLELSSDDPGAKTLDEILDNGQFIDVLDECDALLHHKYHLVYAVGDPADLGSGVERWQAAEALLRVVANSSASSRVAKVLRAAHVSCFSPDYAVRLGAYQGTRLNAVVESTVKLRGELKRDLVLDLMDNAPFELMWLNTFGCGSAGDSLVQAITNPSVSLQEALGIHEPKFAPYKCQLLALRGLVAFGVLEHCLEKRYRVDFGLPIPGSRPKKIAIPFRAADVPSERSEFSHPDVCIVLTVLGYYHGGLADCELLNAFQMLLHLDISEQKRQYDQWFASVEDGLNLQDRKALCDVRHVSLADARQVATLCRVYKFCMETINFYLNTCVFPRDTQQYPQRLSRTAWNLVAGDNNIGFSGTNDNHRLLPLSVTQREPNEPSLLGTNGKMIDKILQVTQSYEVVRPSPGGYSIPWQCVLRFAIDKGAQALIDTGALLAGVSNQDAAEFLLDQTDFGFAGVTYYDSRKEHNCWMISEKAHRKKMPLKKASMLEKETFVIFDEARSRGSDMKLLPDAAAVLTLGPKLTKDKLMQGAGRMRQLGCNQTLWIASFDEVAQSILQTSDESELSRISTIDVLNWVMDNTKAEAVRGLLEWAGNGIHFRKTQQDQRKELVDENWSLETLYQEELHLDTIAQVINEKARQTFGDSGDALVDRICHRGFVYGLDDEVCVTSHTDECERELQVEEEVQQEKEIEVMKCSPTPEKIWAYEEILRVKSVEELDGVVQVRDVSSFIRQWIAPKELADLAWTSAQVFGTENFFSSVAARRGLDRMNEFLRVIDVLLMFTNGQVLLLSECEADHVLGLLWASPKCHFRFLNLAFTCESVDRVGELATFRDVHLVLGTRLNGKLGMLSTVACHVYNGETMLTKRQQSVVEPVFLELLGPVSKRETTLSNFVKSRGNSHKWTRSFLHELSCRMDLEDCK